MYTLGVSSSVSLLNNGHVHSVERLVGEWKTHEKCLGYILLRTGVFINMVTCSDVFDRNLLLIEGKVVFTPVLSLAPPVVYAFVKKFVDDPIKLTLICLATGFYPKDVMMKLIMSSGVRPNDDTYQLRKSVDILENDDADYDCYVTHSSLKGPVINIWDGKCSNCSNILVGVTRGGLVGGAACGYRRRREGKTQCRITK
uniref:Ig-like domain-containing protein n=1 Tax=Electrophorus electricus TaxID=8005 RepID=A0A4W4E2T7_ELEEL